MLLLLLLLARLRVVVREGAQRVDARLRLVALVLCRHGGECRRAPSREDGVHPARPLLHRGAAQQQRATRQL